MGSRAFASTSSTRLLPSRTRVRFSSRWCGRPRHGADNACATLLAGAGREIALDSRQENRQAALPLLDTIDRAPVSRQGHLDALRGNQRIAVPEIAGCVPALKAKLHPCGMQGYRAVVKIEESKVRVWSADCPCLSLPYASMFEAGRHALHGMTVPRILVDLYHLLVGY